MNIFFIGPYRQNNFDGMFCRNIINSIGQKHNLFTRPIFYEKIENKQYIDNNIINYEDNDLKNYDCLIQNVKIPDVLNTNQFGKNIVIPILEENSDELLFTTTISKVLFDSNEIDFETLEVFDYDVSFEIDKKRVFDVGPLHAMKKFYFIGEYKKNYDIIMNCIRSFIYVRSKVDSNYILVIFAVNITQPDLAFINNYIQQTYKTFNSPHTVNRVIVCPIQMTQENIYIAHNTGDIFLNFNHHPKNQINLKIAEKLGKHIIDKPIGSLCLNTNGNTTNCLNTVISDKEVIDSFINYIIEDKTKQYSHSINKKNKHIADIL